MTYCFEPVIAILYDRASQEASDSFCCKRHAFHRRRKPCPRQADIWADPSGGNRKGPNETRFPDFPSRGEQEWMGLTRAEACFVFFLTVCGWGSSSPVNG